MLEELVKLNVFAFLLILARVGAMLSILPGIAAGYVNTRFRISLAVGVAAVMNRSFERAARHLARGEAIALLQRGPQWLIVEQSEGRLLLLRAAELARFLEADGASVEGSDAADEVIDLVAMPAERLELCPVHLQATLHEAREIMNREGVDALYVRRQQAPMTFRTFGVVLRDDVEAGYALRV